MGLLAPDPHTMGRYTISMALPRKMLFVTLNNLMTRFVAKSSIVKYRQVSRILRSTGKSSLLMMKMQTRGNHFDSNCKLLGYLLSTTEQIEISIAIKKMAFVIQSSRFILEQRKR